MAAVRLNIGCGADVREGWVNADANPTQAAVDRADMREPLPWPEEYFDGAVANHVLQHLRYGELVPALAELRRVLKGGATLRILVPDVLAAVHAYRSGNVEHFPQIVGDETTLDGLFCAYVTWYSTARSVFTAAWLMELCERAGFLGLAWTAVGRTVLGEPWLVDLDSRPAETLVVEARR